MVLEAEEGSTPRIQHCPDAASPKTGCPGTHFERLQVLKNLHCNLIDQTVPTEATVNTVTIATGNIYPLLETELWRNSSMAGEAGPKRQALIRLLLLVQ